MERFAWHAVLCPGKKEEYVKRHDEIWPEMTAVLNEASIIPFGMWAMSSLAITSAKVLNMLIKFKVKAKSLRVGMKA